MTMDGNIQKAEEEYNADSIVALKGLEAVRKRPGMYIGSTDTRGLHHCVYEVVDNGIDEVMAGFATKVEVTINEDGSITVVDDGRGIPTEINQEEGKSGLEMCLTDLHAGGKFNQNSYKVSGGLHGVGVSVVNALSKKLIATVDRMGKRWRQSYQIGIPDGPVEEIGPSDRHGTTIQFWPDDEMFETVEFDYSTLQNRFRNQAFLNSEATITFEDKRTGKQETFHYEGGVSEFVQYLNRSKTPLHPQPIRISGERNGVSIDIAMQWTDGYNEEIDSVVNTIYTPEGGTHLGIQDCPHEDGQRLREAEQPAEGPHSGGNRYPRGTDGHRQHQDVRAPVRGSDQGQAGKQRRTGCCERLNEREARRIHAREPRHGPADHQEGRAGLRGKRGR